MRHMQKNAPAAGSVEWWLTNDEPRAVALGALGEEPGQDGLTREQRDRQLRIIRPGRRFVPDLTYDERTANDDEPVVWEPADFDPADFEPSDFRYYGPDDTPANWQIELAATACACGCGRQKAPNRRLSFACVKRKQRRLNKLISGSKL
jgi:hypothetical protein